MATKMKTTSVSAAFLPLVAVASLLATPAFAQNPSDKASWKFDFGAGKVAAGTVQVSPATTYSPERGYGFEPATPSRFSVAVPEGNYTVTVTLGNSTAASDTTIKAESRRLMLESIQTKPGQFAKRTFTVNVRTPKITTGGEVNINGREKGPPLSVQWDDKLTLEFNGPHPGVSKLEITRVENATTVFLAGDSTVTDQSSEPWAAWGQMLPRFFKPGVAVANYAESGLALTSFKGQKRQEKLLSALKAGDYVLIQFGHNDQKDKAPGAGPFTSYKTNLKEFVGQIKSKGGLPVLVTPMERRRWSADGKPESTLSDYAEAVRQASKEESVPVIDLNAMSLKLYEALGPDKSQKAFVHYPANTFPGQAEALKDNTHFNNYGAYELSRCIVEGIKSQVPALAKLLADDTKPYDPAKPDPVESFALAASPFAASEKPAGS
jgi:lysophospholipase L1-like esterase